MMSKFDELVKQLKDVSAATERWSITTRLKMALTSDGYVLIEPTDRRKVVLINSEQARALYGWLKELFEEPDDAVMVAEGYAKSAEAPPGKTLIEERDERIAELEAEVTHWRDEAEGAERRCARACHDYMTAISGERRIIQADSGDVKGLPLYIVVPLSLIFAALVVGAMVLLSGGPNM
jgi:hypothetical protein